MIFFIECRVTRSHQNISTLAQEVVGHIVHANSPAEAEQKYKNAVKKRYAHEPVKDLKFETLHFASEIQ
jgi:hypothetical protein